MVGEKNLKLLFRETIKHDKQQLVTLQSVPEQKSALWDFITMTRNENMNVGDSNKLIDSVWETKLLEVVLENVVRANGCMHRSADACTEQSQTITKVKISIINCLMRVLKVGINPKQCEKFWFISLKL